MGVWLQQNFFHIMKKALLVDYYAVGHENGGASSPTIFTQEKDSGTCCLLS